MPAEPKEELEFLKREEIRTMPKDIARLREIEAKKERERIAALKAEEKRSKPPSLPPVLPKEEPLIPKPPRLRPSLFKKILVRGTILMFFLFLSGFFYWLLAVKPAKKVIPPEETVPPPREEIVEKPEIIIPLPLISVEETRIFEISKIEEIPQVFSQIMAEELPEGKFIRIVMKNIVENRLISLEDLSTAFQIETPEEIFQKIDPDYTLTIYSQKEGKRIALITKIKEKEKLTDLLKNWEKKIKKEGIFLTGQKISALVPYFRTAFSKSVSFRYLTISREDLGICYLLFNDYFVITTSYESMEKIIDELTLVLREES